MAPGLVGPEKTALGKSPTDTWWHTIVSPNGHEKTGYPTQKPRGILDRIVKVHSRPGDRLLDFFAGSGTFGESALAKVEWLKPVAAEMFVGKYDPAHLRLLDKLIAAAPASPLHGVGAHDDRDWESIRAWADALPAVVWGLRKPRGATGAMWITGHNREAGAQRGE